MVLLDAVGTVRAAHRLRLGQDWRQIVAGILTLGRGCDLVVVDAAGVGSPVAEALAERVPVLPFVFTGPSKQVLVRDLAAVIAGRRLRVAPEAPSREELREEPARFAAIPTRTGWRFSGEASGHDDMVLALAVHGHEHLRKVNRKVGVGG